MKDRFVTLAKREFWEHRSLWMAPAIGAGVLLALVIVGAVFAHSQLGWSNVRVNGVPMGSASMTFGPNWGGRLPPGVTPAYVGVYGLASQLFFVALLTCGFYLLDCLYAERKDRSILFWKSLPVSDAQTVLAKYAVAMLVVPLGVYLLTAVIYPLIYAIATAGFPSFGALSGGWKTLEWLNAEGYMLLALLVSLLWYAPLAAWAMLASVLTRRSPHMIATLPIVVVGICEGIVFHTGYVWRFAAWRLVPISNPGEGLTRPGLWIGLAVAAGMLYIVTRLRRYRDDT